MGEGNLEWRQVAKPKPWPGYPRIAIKQIGTQIITAHTTSVGHNNVHPAVVEILGFYHSHN